MELNADPSSTARDTVWGWSMVTSPVGRGTPMASDACLESQSFEGAVGEGLAEASPGERGSGHHRFAKAALTGTAPWTGSRLLTYPPIRWMQPHNRADLDDTRVL